MDASRSSSVPQPASRMRPNALKAKALRPKPIEELVRRPLLDSKKAPVSPRHRRFLEGSPSRTGPLRLIATLLIGGKDRATERERALNGDRVDLGENFGSERRGVENFHGIGTRSRKIAIEVVQSQDPVLRNGVLDDHVAGRYVAGPLRIGGGLSSINPDKLLCSPARGRSE